MTTKVALYCRVSTSTDKHGQTTSNQMPELTAYCDRMDYQVTKIYEDQISGRKPVRNDPHTTNYVRMRSSKNLMW